MPKASKKKIKGIISDFDGVLSTDRFYITLKDKYPDAHLYITTDFFKNQKPIVKDWMRGNLTADDVNRIIAKNTGLNFDFLKREFEEGVRLMELNKDLIDFITKAKKKGVKTAILTDNMDVFTEIFVPFKELDKLFDEIVSSYEYKTLKGDNEGELLNSTRKLLDIDFSNILILDDWETIGEFSKARNSNFYLYNEDTKNKFEEWFNERYYF